MAAGRSGHGARIAAWRSSDIRFTMRRSPWRSAGGSASRAGHAIVVTT